MSELVHVPSVTTSSVLELVPEADRLVSRIASTSFVPKAYRAKPDELLAAILTGHELGLPPMTAMSKVHNIEGTATLSAEAMRALVLSRGHELWVEDASDHKVIVGGRRAGSDKVTHITWTMDMAKKANLVGKANWRKHPQQMLLARATAQLCRTIFPDCLAGISYSYEEAVDGDLAEDDTDDVVTASERPADAPKPKAPSRTRKAPAKKRASKPAPRRVPAQVDGDPMDDFGVIDGLAEDAEERPVEEKRAQMLAIRVREVLGDLDSDDRLELYARSTGRVVKSGKDLSSADVDKVLVDLQRVEAGDLEWRGRQLVEIVAEAEVVDDDDDAEPGGFDEDFGVEASWGEDRWRAFLAEKGVKPVQVLREGRAQAKELGVEQPDSFETLVGCGNQELLALVRMFVEDKAS